MTRERAKELLPVIQALAEGKTVQFKGANAAEWSDCPDPIFLSGIEYRVKPEPMVCYVRVHDGFPKNPFGNAYPTKEVFSSRIDGSRIVKFIEAPEQ